MFDFSLWLPQIYENNLQDTFVWDTDSLPYQKLEKMVAQIVIKSLFNGNKGSCFYKKKDESSVFSSETKNITKELLR